MCRGDSTKTFHVKIGSNSIRPDNRMQEQYRAAVRRTKAVPQNARGLRPARETNREQEKLIKRIEALEKELTELRSKVKE